METTQTLGTKPDPIGTGGVSTAPTGMPIVQLVIALGIVFVLIKYILPKALGRINKRITTGIGSHIRIQESAAFAGGNLYLVDVKGKSLLLSVSTQGVQCLADVTETPEVQKESEVAKVESKPEPTFSELIEAAPAVPEFVLEHSAQRVDATQPTSEDVQRVLDRLARLQSV